MVQDAPEPAASAGEAVVRVVRAGITAAEVAAARGLVPGAPSILGHELVGVVERVEPASGREKDRGLVGQRVVSSIEVACGKCDLCKRGLSNHCRDLGLLGLAGRDGCLAERVSVPVRSLAVVPAEVSDDAAVFSLGAAAALHAAQLVRLEGRGYITVLGDNVAALLAAQAMAKLNASVRIVGSDPACFARAEKWGIKHRAMDDAGRRHDQDVVVDCSGTSAGMDVALRMVRPRGTVIVGATTAPVWEATETMDLGLVARQEVSVVGARSGRVADGVAAIAEGRFDVTGLITKRVKLADAVTGLRAASEGGQIKVVVEM